MLRCAILGEPAGWHVGRLATAIRARGHEATIVRWHELAAEIDGAGGESFRPAAIGQADIVVVRGMPGGGLEEVIFRMNLLGRVTRQGTPVINSPRALEVAIDKYLSLARMAEAGIPVPRTIVAQDAAGIEHAWRALGDDAVVKPIFGSRGRGIERLTSREQLSPYLEAASRGPQFPTEAAVRGAVCYLQEFLPHPGWDVRVLLVGERVFAMRRVSSDDWRLNVSRGARAEPFEPPAEWVGLAKRAAAAVGAEIAGVDLLPTSDGRIVVVEINAVPGWRGLEATVGQNIAAATVDHLERRLIGWRHIEQQQKSPPDCQPDS